ncbi:MAG TPA: cytochrome c [Thermoanaerobaculia bacterium]|nr:cytochrome c [Thermoanaerobaculia bacterium]
MRPRPALLLSTAALLLLAACAQGPEGREPEALYAHFCARCHGAGGEGDRRNLALYPGLDLTRSAMIARRERALVHRRIAQGYGPMPGFAHRLSPAEVGALVDFCFQLQPR